MKHFKTFVLHSSISFKDAFDKMFNRITWKPQHMEFMANAETTSMNFFRTLLAEESGQGLCTAEQATYQGEKVLLLLDHLYVLMDYNAENHYLLTLVAISTGLWIAERKGEIKELKLIVSGIASFANQSFRKQELEEIYEISLLIMNAVDDYLKADLDKRNSRRPWRYLCLNHCIIATRTGNGNLARLSYDRLIKYLPEEAEAFFKMGMQKVNAGKYSLDCRNLIQGYYEMYSSDLHQQQKMSMRLN
jgi:hypothetical protein